MGAQARSQAVAFHQLMRHIDLGGNLWIRRFSGAFLRQGVLSQSGVFPVSDKIKLQTPVYIIWNSSVKRCNERARASGYRNIDALWGKAIAQVREGWLGEPAEFSSGGDIEFFPCGETNAAFRFGLTQWGELRARGFLRRNLADIRAAVLTPIALPSWGHMAQFAKNIHENHNDWDFLKADRASAYKNPSRPRSART